MTAATLRRGRSRLAVRLRSNVWPQVRNVRKVRNGRFARNATSQPRQLQMEDVADENNAGEAHAARRRPFGVAPRAPADEQGTLTKHDEFRSQ